MSKDVMYTELGNRALSEEDLKKVGVEGFEGAVFPRNIPVTVSSAEIANALVAHPEIFGNFVFPGVEDDSASGDSSSTPTAKASKPAKVSDEESLG